MGFDRKGPLRGPAATAKTSQRGPPEGAGESGRLGFAVEGYRLPAFERRRRVNQHGKGCQTVALGGFEGGKRTKGSRIIAMRDL